MGYLRRIVGDQQLAQDLLQETFLLAIRSKDKLTDVYSPRAWLFGVARNLAMNTIRRRPSVVSLPANLSQDCCPPDPRVEEMRQAISKLPPTQQETLELRLSRDLSYQEIATVLEIPLGTVRSRLHNAVNYLRQVMQKAPRVNAGE